VIAEKLRKRVAATPMLVHQVEVPVTVSIGVAANDRTMKFPAPDALINAADKAVYAAKHAGRNCTRIAA